MKAMILQRPLFAALLQKAREHMDVILHLGAHRTASTSFQHYMRENSAKLEAQGIGFWGPRRTRKGLLTGVIPCPGTLSGPDQFDRARGRIMVNLQKAKAQGVQHLIVSDENAIGAPRRNLRDYRLYGGIGERMARFSQAFGGEINRLVLSIRSPETYWNSVISFAVSRGHKVPHCDDLDRLVTSNRNWREVIIDLACAVPEAEIVIQPYEVFGGRPEIKLAKMIGRLDVPKFHSREWLNRAPNLEQMRQVLLDRGLKSNALPEGDGRWQLFNKDQTTALREAYADDLHWLRAGAEGLATLAEETGPAKVGLQPLVGQTIRGRTNGIKERRLA